MRAAEQQPTQLTLDLGDRPELTSGTGLPELTGPERVRAELDILGLDASAHVVEFYAPMLDALGVTRSRDLLTAAQPLRPSGRAGSRSRPRPRRSGRAAGGVPHPRRLHRPGRRDVLRGRPGPVRRHGLPLLDAAGARGGASHRTAWHLAAGHRRVGAHPAVGGVAGRRPEAVYAAMEACRARGHEQAQASEAAHAGRQRAAAGRRVLVHASGFRQSPYADTSPPGEDVRGSHRLGQGSGPGPWSPTRFTPPRKLWHSSPGQLGALGVGARLASVRRASGRPAAVAPDDRRRPRGRTSSGGPGVAASRRRCAPRRSGLGVRDLLARAAGRPSAGRCGCSTSVAAPAGWPSPSPSSATT